MTACRSQGPEHCHIDFIKKLADCTNNRDVFLTILRCHVRAGHIQYLRNLQTDLEDAEGEGDDDIDINSLMADRDDGISGTPCSRPSCQGIRTTRPSRLPEYILLYNM